LHIKLLRTLSLGILRPHQMLIFHLRMVISMHMHDPLQEANKQRFGDISEFDFPGGPYHALRLKLAAELLVREVNRQFHPAAPNQVRVLELGSSTGYGASILAEASGYQVFASDLEHQPLTVAASRNITCVQLDASRSFPFGDQVFDAVFMAELIEHIFDTERLLRECRRVLKNRGVLVITTPNLAGLKDRIRFIFGVAPGQVDPLHRYFRLHIRPFTFSLLSFILRKTGFEPLRLESTYVDVGFRYLGLAGLQSRFLARVLPRLGSTLIVAAQRRDEPDPDQHGSNPHEH
jgi:SAM-dependent methyltransferase